MLRIPCIPGVAMVVHRRSLMQSAYRNCWRMKKTRAALREFEDRRLDTVNKIVLTNRSQPPDYIIETVDKLTGESRSRGLKT